MRSHVRLLSAKVDPLLLGLSLGELLLSVCQRFLLGLAVHCAEFLADPSKPVGCPGLGCLTLYACTTSRGIHEEPQDCHRGGNAKPSSAITPYALANAQGLMLDMGKLFEREVPAPGAEGAGASDHPVGRRCLE